MGGIDSRRLLYCGAPAIHLPLLTRLSVARSISALFCQLLHPISVLPTNSTEPIPVIPSARGTPLVPGSLVSCRLAVSFSYAPSNCELKAADSSLEAEAVPVDVSDIGAGRRVVVPTNRISREGQAVPMKAGDRVRAMHRWQQRPGSARKRRTWRL